MVIGITGGFCTGKSQTAQIFREFGAKIIDLDRLAHKALEPKTESFKKIIKEFGKDVLKNKRIDRLILAKKVFENRERLTKLNSIIHPIVIKEMLGFIKRFTKKYKVIAVEAPLLFEAGLKNYFDYIVVIKTNKKTQLRRATIKTGLSKTDILKRINSQWPIERKISQADFIVDNSGSRERTRRQTKKIWERLKSSENIT